ncbi:hypothetical protein G6F37_001351 [Rhizopus arrhizus]|nr:hypothetical protein G6F38_002012 [Rhizopus arrhizus]KAG1163286.1 hypothetical protein G6F37_001351 [Rhizopus arrhizus]
MYVNWDSQIEPISSLKWYKVDSFISYLHDVRQYLTQTIGKFSASYLPRSIEQVLPATANQRFPATESWLCEGLGEWSMKYDLLSLALNVALHPHRLERKYPEYETAGEVEYYCLMVINDLLHLLASPEEAQVVQRSVFEQKYGLRWAEESKTIGLPPTLSSDPVKVNTAVKRWKEDAENDDEEMNI